MVDPDSNLPRMNRGTVYIGACLIAGIRLARASQVNVRVVPTGRAIDESVELAHEIYNKFFVVCLPSCQMLRSQLRFGGQSLQAAENSGKVGGMMNLHGILLVLGMPYPYSVEVYAALVDNESRKTDFGLGFPPEPWASWKERLLLTMTAEDVSAAEVLLQHTQEHSFGLRHFEVPNYLDHRDWVPRLDRATNLRRQILVSQEWIDEAVEAQMTGRPYIDSEKRQGTVGSWKARELDIMQSQTLLRERLERAETDERAS